MRVKIDASLSYHFAEAADVVLTLEAIRGGDQAVISDHLSVTPSSPLTLADGPELMGRRQWTTAAGDVTINYQALVDVTRGHVNIAGLYVPLRRDLPYDVITYLMPSRYCESDRLAPFAESQFSSGAQGGDQVLEMAAWIYGNFEYAPGASTAATTATDSFLMRRGVCRDYAHTLIGFCRAVGIPARMVSAYAPGINPPDFHAVVEVWLDNAWHLIDPTRLAAEDSLVRIAVGRDATDISFMTIFGAAELQGQRVSVSVAVPETAAT
ncbi:MAG: transglutaminase family protein [Hyphomonas sp.]|uniref:transglutaminase-like domain-containing protein n=1 Tax=Hyphomonas sp. TaxID=87 RepID=UPI0017F7B397|nr:transglutaminase family protein [Hyphomonas sp.]MBA3066877.1 transglutaminase family protein [Hyphomonas sp.]MBU3922307.1 transglutaminase family protein [Alphaproteobacteria bacterium]MBU4060956.1 transglutaminase family protein [Alphaproteobacteria bacterium]MBU4166164.1 transglutaminase family protein [Alphaproteobacteria bacterium]